jgi:hypothetical protein
MGDEAVRSDHGGADAAEVKKPHPRNQRVRHPILVTPWFIRRLKGKGAKDRFCLKPVLLPALQLLLR